MMTRAIILSSFFINSREYGKDIDPKASIN